MGLDCFWKLPEGSNDPEFYPPLRLCGGMLSAQGGGSFRGKVYAEFILKYTKFTLYSDLNPEDVRELSKRINDLDPNEIDLNYWFDNGYSEFNDLRRMFRAYADSGASLIAWY